MTDKMDLLPQLEGLDVGTLSVLDLGCGHNDSPISKQVLILPVDSLTSVDIHRPYLDLLRDKPVAAGQHWIVGSEILTYVAGQAETENHFDVTLMFDVLEHFTQEDGLKLLKIVETITRKRIIIWIPLGLCAQEEYDDNPYQAHLSTWNREDLEALGYRVDRLADYHRPVAWVVKDLD